MKKILIPIIGLFVLILLTPYILGRVANSNIDDKLSNLKNKTIKIEQISKDVSYLYSKRVFKVKIDKSYFEFPIKGDFLVTLTFKNLPITTAKFDVEIKRLKNFRELKGYRFSILTKDLKTFNLKGIDNKVVKGLEGEFYKKKYLTIKNFKIDFIKTDRFLFKKLVSKGEIKDFDLGLVDLNGTANYWELKLNRKVTLKGKNTTEHFETHLSPDKKYKIDDYIKSETFGIQKNDTLLGFANVKSDFKFNDFDIDWSFEWDTTEIFKTMVDGGEFNLKGRITSFQNDGIDVKIGLKLSDTLFKKVTNKFDPKIVKKYFNGYETTIKIDKKGIFINENRVQ